MSLINDGNVGGKKEALAAGGALPKLSGEALLAIEPFEGVFGSKKTRKRPRLQAADLATLALQVGSCLCQLKCSGLQHFEPAKNSLCEGRALCMQAEEKEAAFQKSVSAGDVPADDAESGGPVELIFQKGTSRRIWGELYKVIDASDVLVQVVDARDPMGTRCRRLEKYLKAHRSSKHLVLVDLVPPRVARYWLQQLSKEMPTLLLQADKNKKNFGRNQLFQLLRQYGQLLSNRKHVSIGFFGYPNVGKSSIINFLKSKQVCKAAPIPGQTRVWQYVALTSKLYLIDCPGIVPISSEAGTDTDKVMRGVVRPERINAPEEHIQTVLEKVKREAILARYGLDSNISWEDAEEFLSILAVRLGKLKKGGEPDISTAARIMLYDLQRGKLPYYVLPPCLEAEAAEAAAEADGTPLDGAVAVPEGNALKLDGSNSEDLADKEEINGCEEEDGTQRPDDDTQQGAPEVSDSAAAVSTSEPNKRARIDRSSSS
ncbi:nucleolar GTP-binding protein NOG2, putative [Eimeria necatrix]|uniref:Nucleolar GTP-binding protein NOG2, putative n=1 Tax=Eimeria necatrix TaxID=51315 RepID=U6MMA7_9EIME|nr:nucleolar GTP-binding protein NOG2, putative [Eimeria necatrix]CDJ65146.1 nucleolar GTP-binding protein NOG2, putative [Eimeria necatrix]